MQDSKYNFFQEHKRQHNRFLEHVAMLEAEVASGAENPTFLSFRIKMLLANWLVDHSAKSDRHFGHFLQSRRGG